MFLNLALSVKVLALWIFIHVQPLVLGNDIIESVVLLFALGIFLENIINGFEIKRLIPRGGLTPELVGLLNPVTLLDLVIEVRLTGLRV